MRAIFGTAPLTRRNSHLGRSLDAPTGCPPRIHTAKSGTLHKISFGESNHKNSAAMFANALLILPDFATILIGFALTRWLAYDGPFWRGAERLVYTVLFPALLFQSINGAHFSIGAESRLLAATGGAFLGAVTLAFAARRLFSPPADVFASTVQTAFRFNSYVGLAVAQSLFGSEGVALFALIVA
jgi:predicted permease